MPVLEYIISTIAPHTCLACGFEGSLLCKDCQRVLPAMPPLMLQTPLAAVYSRTAYEGAAKQLVHNLKFERAQAAAKDIALAMHGVVPAPELEGMVVTYVPTATSRVRQRGYDQAALIAKEFARRHGLPCLPLLRRRDQTRQVGTGRQERLRQAHDAFAVSDGLLAANRSVLLIDDVLTTGATLQAAAKVLHAAGTAHVVGLTFARAGTGLD